MFLQLRNPSSPDYTIPQLTLVENLLFYMDNLGFVVDKHLINRGFGVPIIFTPTIDYNTFLLSTTDSFFSTLTVELPVIE